eukprot:142266_1
MSNKKKRRFSTMNVANTDESPPMKKIKPAIIEAKLSFKSSHKILNTLKTIKNSFIMHMDSKTLCIISDYAAFDSLEHCINCNGSLFLVNEDFIAEKCADDPNYYFDTINKLTNNKWNKAKSANAIICNNCSSLCEICSEFTSASKLEKCDKCKWYYCNDFECVTNHSSNCVTYIPFKSIQQLMNFNLDDWQNTSRYEENLKSIYFSLSTKDEYKHKLRTTDQFYPFKSYKFSPKEIKYYLKLNKLLQTHINENNNLQININLTLTDKERDNINKF